MVGTKDLEMPNTCDDYYCKALDRFMKYDEVDGSVDILGKPSDCPLIEAIPKADYETRLKANIVAVLDKIRAEIKALPTEHTAYGYNSAGELVGVSDAEFWTLKLISSDSVLEILDKYKAENEDKE